jgi:hypothetical protein
MIQKLAQTKNFVIQYQDTFSDAKRRAQALQKTVETDFAKVLGWFGVNSGFGPGNLVILSVDAASLAFNHGYKNNGTTLVQMNPFQGGLNQDLADDAVRALFIAEIVEVLMDYNNQVSKNVIWVAGFSNGEGLSRVCAALFYPDGYYSPFLSGPFVNGWLSSSTRNDWVSQNEQTDKDGDSFGCAILFIFYLYSQLGYSMNSIITKAGATLEATYQNLTGKSGGFAAFTGLINPYFPPGKPTSLATDDPFPILQGNSRTVQINCNEQIQNTLDVDSSGTVEISPYFTCPVAKYAYTIYNVAAVVQAIASVSGFAQPVYKWKINGQAADIGVSMTFTETVYLDNPMNPAAPTSQSKSVQINYFDQGNLSTLGQVQDELDIFGDSVGHIPLVIEVEVSEKFVQNGSVSASALAELDGQSLVYEDKYYKDRLNCEAAWAVRARQLTRWKWINILLTLPDPPIGEMRSIRILNEVINELGQLQREEPALAREVTTGLAKQLGISSKILQAAKEKQE